MGSDVAAPCIPLFPLPVQSADQIIVMQQVGVLSVMSALRHACCLRPVTQLST
jgi:hypothetical protein